MNWEGKYKLSKSKQIRVRWKSSLLHCGLLEWRLGVISGGSSSLRYVKVEISMFPPLWHSYCHSETEGGSLRTHKDPRADQVCWLLCPAIQSKMEEGEGEWNICCRWLHVFHLKDSPFLKKIRLIFWYYNCLSYKMMVTVCTPFFFLIILLGKNLKPWVSILKS